MMHRRSWYMSGIIASTITVLVFLSVDISPYTNHHDKTPVGTGTQTFLTDVGLITGPTPETWIIKKLDSAQKRISVSVYTFTVPSLRDAILRAKERGVDVEIILEKTPFGNTTINRETTAFLTKNHIPFHESGARQFSFMHAKYMIIDDAWIVETANWTRASFASNREFFLTGNDPSILGSLEDIFQKDARGDKGMSNDIRLLAGPTNARERLIGFLQGSQVALDIYAPDFSDIGMISAIQTLCSSGKAVRLLLARFADTDMSKNHYNKCLKVRYMKKPLHAKVLIRDHGEAFVGSFNYTKTSLEKNREIGIFLAGESVKSISDTFESDWKQAEVALP